MILRKSIVATDQDIIARCLANDKQAQYTLYSKYSNAMLNVAYRIVNDKEDAKDVLQDAFIKAFTKLDTFKFNSTFGAWLKRIVVNTAINFSRKKGLLSMSGLDPAELNIAENYSEDTSLTLSENVDIKTVNKVLMSLPTGYRTVLSLYLIEGYDHEEISQIMNISKSTSLTQFKRGKARLKALVYDELSKMNQNG